MSSYLKLCEQAARRGGEVLQSWVGRFQVHSKGPSDLVTQADFASQEAIRSLVLETHPSHQFIGEEGPPAAQSAEYCWVVDPLDGTTNYVHQLPHYAVSVALLRHGQPLAAAVFDPVREECFCAERGQGATLNGRRLHTSGITQLSEALVAASLAARVRPDSPEVAQLVALLDRAQAIRRTGSAALNLAYVACGRMDAFWSQSTNAWDVAAGVLLIEEAGGVISDLDGSPFDLARPHPIASATAALHEELLRLLRSSAGR